MNNIKEITNNIYNYCIYAMDYDLMGLIFSETSFMNALNTKKEILISFSEDEFDSLNEALKIKVLTRYKSEDEDSSEYGVFLTYLKCFSFTDFKKILA